jgi:hypothetical protein
LAASEGLKVVDMPIRDDVPVPVLAIMVAIDKIVLRGSRTSAGRAELVSS